MPRELLIDALGAHVRIDLDGLSDDDAAAIAGAWRDATVDPAETRSGPVVGWGEPPLAWPKVTPLDTDDAALRLSDLSQRVTLAAIDAQRGTRWMLHAAGLTDDEGRVVVLVGPSGRGKTTAARALGAHFGYLSDETVAIEMNGRAHAYRKPLSIIEDDAATKVQRAPSDVGLRPLPDAELRVAAILLLDRRDDDSDDPPVVDLVELDDALGDLVTQSSYLTAMSAPLQDIAAMATATGGIRRVIYREASDLAPVIASLLAEATFDDGARPPKPRVAGAPTPHRRRGWFRTPAHDLLVFEDPERIAVLLAAAGGEGALRVLAGVAPTIWRAAAGVTIDDLVSAAVSAHGAPEGQDARTLVDAAVQSLAAEGVLEWREGRWGIRDDVAWTGGGDRIVALSLADLSAAPRAVEASGAVIWNAVAEGDATTDEVVERVSAAVGVDADLVAGDVAGFLAELHAAQLLELR